MLNTAAEAAADKAETEMESDKHTKITSLYEARAIPCVRVPPKTSNGSRPLRYWVGQGAKLHWRSNIAQVQLRYNNFIESDHELAIMTA